MNKFTSKSSNKNINKSSNKNSHNNSNEQVKIYFPSISIQVLQSVLDGSQNKTKKEQTLLHKYLHNEKQKTAIYATTSILEIHNNQLYSIYPSDKVVLTSSICLPKVTPTTKNIELLIDYSNMKRSQSVSYQIPYEFKVHSCLVKTYKLNPKSNTCFVIEYKDNKVYDFYMLVNIPKLSNVSLVCGNYIELDNFIKEDIISFLLMLNLY